MSALPVRPASQERARLRSVGALALLAVVALCACAADGGLEGSPAGRLARAAGPVGNAGVVSSAHPLATEAGLEVLEKGGNAFDAAVAVASTLTVAEPMNSNLFGGFGTILIFDAKSGKVRYLDSGGRFPAATNADVFRKASSLPEVLRTAQAVSTPTNLHAFEKIWREYGSLPWAGLLGRATELAADGIEVSEPMARAIDGTWKYFSDYSRSIYGSAGKPLVAGDRLVQADLARSFGLAAKEGSAALYGGPLGEAMVQEVQRRGGFLAASDLAADEAQWFDPISIDFRGNRLVTAGPPANSFASVLAVGIMSRYSNSGSPNTVEYLHRMAEANKRAFWARLKYAGGPEENAPPLDRLLSEAYWQEQVAAIDPAKASRFVPPSAPGREGLETTHFVVADREGNVVSATITLGESFGSAVMVPGTGIWLNNSMAYCTFFPAGNPMDALPGRRKHASMSPALILRDGRVWAAIGSPGGHTIPQVVAQLAVDLVDFGMPLQDALDAPRLAFADPDVLLVDRRVPEEVRNGLRGLGHQVRETDGIGLTHALTIEYGDGGKPVRFTGAAERRGIGKAMALEALPGR